MSEPQGRQNQGYLFPNQKSHDRQPDFRGRVNVNGTDYLLSGWLRPKDGQEMISLSVTDPATLPPRGSGQNQGQSQSQNQNQSQNQPSNQGGGSSSGGVGSIFDDLPG